MNGYGTLLEWYWRWKPEALGEKPVPVLLCTWQMSQGLTWNEPGPPPWLAGDKPLEPCLSFWARKQFYSKCDISVANDERLTVLFPLAPSAKVRAIVSRQQWGSDRTVSYLVSELVSEGRVLNQCHKEQRPPKQNVRRSDDQEHLHSLDTFAFHPSQIIAHAPLFLNCPTSTADTSLCKKQDTFNTSYQYYCEAIQRSPMGSGHYSSRGFPCLPFVMFPSGLYQPAQRACRWHRVSQLTFVCMHWVED